MRLYKRLVVGVFATTLAVSAHAKAKERILPDACGSDAIQFDIAVHKADAPPAPPADGKAQIVFIQTLVVKDEHFLRLGSTEFPTRFGLDGVWVGAGTNNSYMTVDVAPGELHLCGSVQGTKKELKEMVGATSLTAEPGKVYYYEFKVLRFGRELIYSSAFQQIEPDEGKFRVKAYSISVATPHH